MHQYFSKSRVEAFSDGIFAIIVTLLVLEIKVPHIHDEASASELLQALYTLFPKLISWILSFLMVCVIWVNHHRLFNQLNVITHSIFWLNALLLLSCSFIPFPTALLGDYIHNTTALVFFGIIMSFMSFCFYLIRLNMLNNPKLLIQQIDIVTFKKVTKRALIFGTFLYLLGAVGGCIHPFLALGIYAAIPLYFIFNK